MATRTFSSNNGNHRMTISTILTHAFLFHEAGLEITTEIKTKVKSEWWNPFSWAGQRWDRSNNANQPVIEEFFFIQGADIKRNPNDFAVQTNQSIGNSKTTCIYGNAGGSPLDTGLDARSVNNILVTFKYNGRRITLRHSDN